MVFYLDELSLVFSVKRPLERDNVRSSVLIRGWVFLLFPAVGEYGLPTWGQCFLSYEAFALCQIVFLRLQFSLLHLLLFYIPSLCPSTQVRYNRFLFVSHA